MSIRAFIIDDEAPARRELRYLLDLSGLETVGEAPNAALGLKGIRETAPDIVFLDIKMPGLSGLDLSHLLAEIPNRPLVVFATAFEKYAKDAFDAEAFDYILKPFTLERVQKTVQKAEKLLLGRRKDAAETTGTKKIPLYRDGKIIPVSPGKIIFAKYHEGEILVKTTGGMYRTRATLNELEQALAAYSFLRTHRSSLINLDHVLEIIPWFNGSYKLIMNDGERTEVLVSRYHAKALRKYFDL